MLLLDVQLLAVANASYFTCYPSSPKEAEMKPLISVVCLLSNLKSVLYVHFISVIFSVFPSEKFLHSDELVKFKYAPGVDLVLQNANNDSLTLENLSYTYHFTLFF